MDKDKEKEDKKIKKAKRSIEKIIEKFKLLKSYYSNDVAKLISIDNIIGKLKITKMVKSFI